MTTTTALAALLALAWSAPGAPPARAAPAQARSPAEAEPGCVQRRFELPPGLSVTKKGTVYLGVSVGPGGEVNEVSVPDEVPAPLAEAFRAAARACAFTPGRSAAGVALGGRVLLPVRLAVTPPTGPPPGPPTGPPGQVSSAAPPPPLPDAGGAPPREERPGCVGDMLELPPNRLLRGIVAFTVEVGAEGKVERVVVPPELERDVAQALERAVGFCTFHPATGPDGAPRPGALVLRFRFTVPGEDERQAQAGRLKREAKLANSACMQRLRGFGLVGHAAVSLRISETGVPSDMRLQPESTPAEMRIQIFDTLTACLWEPAIGLDDKPVASTTTITIRYR